MRKKIVIGETYIFDALGETNMSVTTSLVTVVKKKGFRKYTVISANDNETVFTTKAKYLTPIADTENIIIRCQYGTTDITPEDVFVAERIDSVCDLLIEILDKVEYPDTEFIEHYKVEASKLTKKLRTYALISTYKDTIKSYKRAKRFLTPDKPSHEEEKEKYNKFSRLMDDNVHLYITGKIPYKIFSKNCKGIIDDNYMSDIIKHEEDHVTIDKDDLLKSIEKIICEISSSINGGSVTVFIIVVDKNGKVQSKPLIVFGTENDDDELLEFDKKDIYKFFTSMYPEIENKSVSMKYSIGVFAVKNRNDEFPDDEEEL